MEPTGFNYDQLAATVRNAGPAAAADHLLADLADGRDPTALFYAKLLKGRLSLGVSPYPTGSSHDLPVEMHEPYEAVIRDAARSVGGLLLEKNDIPQAWPFFRLINEPEPIRSAIDSYSPGDEEDVYPLIDIAFHQGVSPDRGFDLMLSRQGICATITLLSQTDLSKSPELRETCLAKLIDALSGQLRDRLIADLAGRGIVKEGKPSIGELLDRHPELTEGEAYHIDVSHLQSVVQMGSIVRGDAALRQLVDLCRYGEKLASQFAFSSDPPFDDGYPDYRAQYELLLGINVDPHIQRFTDKAKSAMAEGMTYPCHVLVELLGRLGRDRDALAVAMAMMASQNPAEFGGPNLTELARKVNDHAAVAQLARAANDPVTFLAAVIASS
jgi:hypothetical protein